MLNPLKYLPHRKTNMQQLNGFKVVKDVTVRTSDNIPVRVKTVQVRQKNEIPHFSTNIYDENGNITAYNTFIISPDTKELKGLDMRVSKITDRQKHGFGEILRLASTINLLENGLDKISIFAISEAIPFHFKYKFKPNITRFDEVLEILDKLSRESEPSLKSVKEEASAMLNDRIALTNNFNYGEKCSELVEKFLKIREHKKLNWISDIKSHGVNFHQDIDMNLKSERIIENKDFFNALFEKHGFDYKI